MATTTTTRRSADPKLDADYVPRASSPCVNAGRNASVGANDTDLLGRPRIRLFGGAAKHDVVDMGCFETDFPCRQIGTRFLVQ